MATITTGKMCILAMGTYSDLKSNGRFCKLVHRYGRYRKYRIVRFLKLFQPKYFLLRISFVMIMGKARGYILPITDEEAVALILRGRSYTVYDEKALRNSYADLIDVSKHNNTKTGVVK